MCTRRRVIAVWLCTALILAAVSFPLFFIVTYPHDPTDPDPYCFVQPAFDRYWYKVWYWLDFTLLAFVPFVVILAGNCVIVTCLVRAVRFRHRQESYMFSSAFPPSSGGAVAAERGKSVTSSTVMMMTLSVVFLVTTSPNVIYFLKKDDWFDEDNNDAYTKALQYLIFTVTNLLYHTNNATNFFLYCLAGSRFRQALCQMFSRRPKREGRSVGVQGGHGNRIEMVERQRRTSDAPRRSTLSTIRYSILTLRSSIS